MIIEILLGLTSSLFIVSVYVIINLIKKTELLETWVEDFSQRIQQVQAELTTIDHTGHFEADDEIGTIFEEIKETINTLNEFAGEELDA